MADDFKYDVFLSHGAKDKPIVRDVAERLRKDGLRVWLDEWILKPGDHVQAKIEEGLEQSRVLAAQLAAAYNRPALSFNSQGANNQCKLSMPRN